MTIPGPEGGASLEHDPLDTITELSKQYGGIVRLDSDAVLITSAEIAEEILVKKPGSFRKGRAAQRMAEVFGRGTLLLEGDAWRQRRRLVQPAFSRERIEALGGPVYERTVAHMAAWPRSVDLREVLLPLFMDLTVRNLFKQDVTGRMRTLVDGWKVLFNHLSNRFGEQSTSPQVDEARRTVDEIVWDLIAARREQGDDGSLLARLVAARDEDGSAMTDQELRDEVMTLFVGGYETSTTAAMFALGLLAQHSDIAAAHVAEVDSVCKGQMPEFSHLAELSLNRQILEETMRLFPPSWLFTREAIEDETIGGHRINAGSQLLVSPWGIHRSEVYWAEPERFDPTRFTPNAVRLRHRLAWIPFGGGPRKCLGSHYAMVELQLVLATVVQRLRIALDTQEPIEAAAAIGLRPSEPLHARVSVR